MIYIKVYMLIHRNVQQRVLSVLIRCTLYVFVLNVLILNIN